MQVVTMLRNAPKSMGCPIGEGETGPVESALAGELVRLGIASVVEPPKPIRGVPDSPTIMADPPHEPLACPIKNSRQSRHQRK